ncbi:MAG: OmpH family outer membrane protein [Bacteroidaceae bacterium]|nr:OmpH family outer membrane protein [Bacteroidaceae bacterium]
MKKILFALLLMLPMSVMAQKFGHYNSQDIIPTMPEYTAGQAELEKLAKTMEEDMKRMQDEIQTKYQDYEKQRDALPENIRTRRETELQQLQERFQQAYQDNQQEMQKKQQELVQSIQQKLSVALKKIGDAQGFVYIMDAASGIPYISSTLSTDITPDIKKELGL